jgi:hypothetical protein
VHARPHSVPGLRRGHRRAAGAAPVIDSYRG